MVDLGLWGQVLYVQFLGLLLSGFVTLDKLFNFTMLQFYSLKNGNYKIYFMVLFC